MAQNELKFTNLDVGKKNREIKAVKNEINANTTPFQKFFQSKFQSLIFTSNSISKV